MRRIEQRLIEVEVKLMKKFLDTCFNQLRIERNKNNPKWEVAFSELKAHKNTFLNLNHPAGAKEDIQAVNKFNQNLIAIFEHHLPESAARIREQIPWL